MKLCDLCFGSSYFDFVGINCLAGGDKPLLGDILLVVGTLYYAMSNVGEEFCVKKKDRVEVISILSIFGWLVSLCEMYHFHVMKPYLIWEQALTSSYVLEVSFVCIDTQLHGLTLTFT